MKIKKNGRVISLSETDLQRIVKRTLNEVDSSKTSSLPSCKKVMRELAKKEQDKNCGKTGKDGKFKTGCTGTAREKVTLKMTSPGSVAPNPDGELIAYKGGKAWCKCG
tara:strand:+ start:68 stop:391 length:324 start_codon:yes stop_codon:yes gene_type:complete